MQCCFFCFVFPPPQDKIQYNCTFTYKKKRGTKQLFFFFPEKSSKLIRKRNTYNTTEGVWQSIYPPYLHKVTRYFLRENKCYQVPAIYVSSQNSQRKLTFIQANSRLLLSTVLQQCLTLLIISYKEYWNIHIPRG